MGMFDKLKNIFYDDIEEEETKEDKKVIKKEEKKPILIEESIDKEEIVKIKDEVVENVKADNTFSERDLFRSERTFNFMEFDEEELPQRPNAIDLERKNYSTPIEQENKKIDVSTRVFRPSPVISPIYGILDKDYKKEEIIEKETYTKETQPEKVTYDSVRKKAYGTFKDDFDSTLSASEIISDKVDDIEEEVDKLNEKTSKIEDLISKIEKSTTIGEIEDKVKEEMFEDTDEIKINNNFDKTVSDDTLEHDLFNLIDSMYDDKED